MSGSTPWVSIAPLDELAAHVFHLAGIANVGHQAPEVVRFLQRHPGKAVRHLQHLFLKQDDAVGIPQNRFQGGMVVADAFLSAPPPHERVDHVALQGTRAEEGDLGNQVVEGLRLMFRQQVQLALRLDLKAADRPPGADEVEGADVVRRQVVGVERALFFHPPVSCRRSRGAAVRFRDALVSVGFGTVGLRSVGLRVVDLVAVDHLLRLADGGEHPQAEDVEFDEAEGLDVVLVELGHAHPVGRHLYGRVAGQGRL